MKLGYIELEVGDELRVWLKDMAGKPIRREPFIAKIVKLDECPERHPIVEITYDASLGELTCEDYVIHAIHRKARGP